MIRFNNWVMEPDGQVIARQFDNLTRTLTVTGDVPEGWDWVMIVSAGEYMDYLPLERVKDGIGITLTDKQLSVAGYCKMQLRGTRGEQVRHTNTITGYIPASLSGDTHWPEIPSQFTDLEKRISETADRAEGYSAHPPVIGENGCWWTWDGQQYADSGKPSQGKQGPQGETGPAGPAYELTEADKAGCGLYVGKDGNIVTDPIPSEAKLREYAALFKDGGEVESFLFFADPHLASKSTLAQIKGDLIGDLQIVRNYYDCTPTNFALCTGDWIDDDYDCEDACFRIGFVRALWRKWFPNGCFALGNHEYNDCGKELLTQQTVHNLLLPEKKKNYYTYDGAITRFYVLDTGMLGYDVTEYGWEQIEWLAEQLLVDNARFSAIASHILYVADTNGNLVLTPFADAVLQLAQAYNNRGFVTLNGTTYGFTDATGFVEFAIGGHKHVDHTMVEYGIPVILSTNVTRAGYGNPTFDLVLADYTNRKLHFVRVGAYSSRVVNLSERTDVPRYNNLVSTAVSPLADEVYNGVGYVDDYRFSSDKNNEYKLAKSGYTLTGLIPYDVGTANNPSEPIYFNGGSIDETEYCRLHFWTADKQPIGGDILSPSVTQDSIVVEQMENGVYKLTPKYRSNGVSNIQYNTGKIPAYFNLCVYGRGSNLIVTIGEPIE